MGYGLFMVFENYKNDHLKKCKNNNNFVKGPRKTPFNPSYKTEAPSKTTLAATRKPVTAAPITRKPETTLSTTRKLLTTLLTTRTTTKAHLSTTTAKTMSDQSPCNINKHGFEAVFQCKYNICVLVRHEELWEYDVKKRKWHKHNILAKYPGIEAGVRGGARDSKSITWFFKGILK